MKLICVVYVGKISRDVSTLVIKNKLPNPKISVCATFKAPDVKITRILVTLEVRSRFDFTP